MASGPISTVGVVVASTSFMPFARSSSSRSMAYLGTASESSRAAFSAARSTVSTDQPFAVRTNCLVAAMLRRVSPNCS